MCSELRFGWQHLLGRPYVITPSQLDRAEILTSNEEQIACVEGKLLVPVPGGELAGANCAFFQNTGITNSAALAKEKIQDLNKHGCGGCGSCPTQAGNDVSTGELTVNFVSSPCCDLPTTSGATCVC